MKFRKGQKVRRKTSHKTDWWTDFHGYYDLWVCCGPVDDSDETMHIRALDDDIHWVSVYVDTMETVD